MVCIVHKGAFRSFCLIIYFVVYMVESECVYVRLVFQKIFHIFTDIYPYRLVVSELNDDTKIRFNSMTMIVIIDLIVQFDEVINQKCISQSH